MLERAGACVEPVSQVLLHRFEPPFRSHRLLSPDFFKNGLNASESAPWWPSFLNSVRCPSQARGIPPRHTRTAASRPHDPSPRKQPLQRRQKTQNPNTVASKPSVRAYSRTAVKSQDVEVAQDSEPFGGHEESVLAQMDSTPYELFPAGHPSSLTDTIQTSPGGERRTLSRSQQRIEQLLQSEGILSLELDRSARDEIWELFIALPDQVLYASRVLQYLSSSTDVNDMNHALSAYTIIPLEDRTQADYNAATGLAARRKRYPLVLQVCKEAMEMGLGEACRQTALLELLRAKLYKSAARLWDECWGRETALHRHDKLGPAVQQTSVQLIDDCPDLPEIFTKSHARLNHADALLLDSDRQCLLRIVQGLGWRIVGSGRIMSTITLEGLLTVFEWLESSNSLKSGHMLQAIRTLCSLRTPRNRHDLAVALYRNFRLRFPDPVPRHILHGLLFLCYRAGESREAIEYVLGEFRRSAVDWSPEPPQDFPGRGDYAIALRALSVQGDVRGVADVYAQFIMDHGQPKTIPEVIPYLYTHAIFGDVSATQKAFDEIQAKWSFTPDTVCWTILMYAHARSDEPHRAFEVLDEMIKHNVKPDSVTYGLLGSICGSVGDESTVLSLLELATQQGFRNIAPLLSTLVEVFCLNGDVEKAENLLRNLHEFKFEGSPVRIWNTLLRHQAYQSSPSAVAKTQEQMKQAGVRPDEMTYATMMAALIEVKKTHDALKILRSLHFSSSISATPFLYSLLLHGFQKEGNRDMANKIFREMQDRFPSLTPSAKLSMLRSEQQRGLAKTRQQIARAGRTMRIDLKEALLFLEEHGCYTPSDKATKAPQPGFERRKAREAVPSIFTETVTEALAMHGKPLQAAELILSYDDMLKPEIGGSQSIRMLVTRMLVAARLYQREEVDRLWAQILQLGIKTSLSPLKLRHTSLALETKSTSPTVVMQEMVDKMKSADVSIQSSRRLSLALPLGRYMFTLNEQGRHADMISVVELFPQLGFSLTSRNWNYYVQALCNSPDPEHQILAFSVFESVLLPNMPSLRALTQGLWIEPSAEKLFRDPGIRKNAYVLRKDLERSQPAKPVPTYETIVWLVSVVEDFWKLATRKLRVAEGTKHEGYLKVLQNQHPELMNRITQLPFQKDRIQRVLLHRSKPAYANRIAFQNFTVSGPGITSSKSVVDQLPVESVDWVSRTLRSRKGRNPDSMAEDIILAEAALGEIVRTPLFLDEQQRWETDREVQGRVQRTELEYLELVEEMERNLEEAPLVMSEATGDPVYRHDWAALADGSIKVTEEQLFDAAGSILPGPRQPTSAPSVDAASQSPPNLDAGITPEMRAKVRSARTTLPRPRIQNTYSLFGKLLPPRPSRSSVDRAFARAKASRRLRLEELRESQRLEEARNLDAKAGDVQDRSSEIAAFARLQEEQYQLDQAMQQRNDEVETLRQAQLRRVSGSISSSTSPEPTNLQSSWPSSFPLGDADFTQQAANARQTLSKSDSSGRVALSLPPDPAEKPKRRPFDPDARPRPRAFSSSDPEHDRSAAVDDDADEDDDEDDDYEDDDDNTVTRANDKAKPRKPKKPQPISRKKARRLKAEYMASLQMPRATINDPTSTTSSSGKETANNNNNDKPFGGWDQGGHGFRSL